MKKYKIFLIGFLLIVGAVFDILMYQFAQYNTMTEAFTTKVIVLADNAIAFLMAVS